MLTSLTHVILIFFNAFYQELFFDTVLPHIIAMQMLHRSNDSFPFVGFHQSVQQLCVFPYHRLQCSTNSMDLGDQGAFSWLPASSPKGEADLEMLLVSMDNNQ